MKKYLTLGLATVAVFLGASSVFAAGQQRLNWGLETDPTMCEGKLSDKALINTIEPVVNSVDSGEGGNFWAFINYYRQIQVWQTAESKWEIVPSGVDFQCGAGTYSHTLDSVTVNPDGTFEGTGTYDANNGYTWNMTGEINGTDVTFSLVYTGINSGYTLNGVGTIAEDGSITGTTDGNCQSFSMDPGAEQTPNEYCSVVKYKGDFQGVEGQTSPGASETLDGDEVGAFYGGYRMHITGDMLDNPLWRTHGFRSTATDHNCDISGNCPGKVNWLDQYFNDGYSYNYDWWGWIYKGGEFGTWINSSDGNSGDIY